MIHSENIIHLSKWYKTHANYYIFTNVCNGGDISLLKKARG